MTAQEKQTGLATIAYNRSLIDTITYNALLVANTSYDLVEMLLELIAEPNEDYARMIYRAAINS